MLARIFLLEELPPWHTNRLRRLVKTPKLHIGNAGLACVLLCLDSAALTKDRTTHGQLLETFVFQELCRLRRQALCRSDAGPVGDDMSARMKEDGGGSAGSPEVHEHLVEALKLDLGSKPSPIPLENCPWCGKRFQPVSFTLLPDDDRPSELRIVCTNFECDFARDRALPTVAMDEPIYRRLRA